MEMVKMLKMVNGASEVALMDGRIREAISKDRAYVGRKTLAAYIVERNVAAAEIGWCERTFHDYELEVTAYASKKDHS